MVSPRWGTETNFFLDKLEEGMVGRLEVLEISVSSEELLCLKLWCCALECFFGFVSDFCGGKMGVRVLRISSFSLGEIVVGGFVGKMCVVCSCPVKRIFVFGRGGKIFFHVVCSWQGWWWFNGTVHWVWGVGRGVNRRNCEKLRVLGV